MFVPTIRKEKIFFINLEKSLEKVYERIKIRVGIQSTSYFLIFS